MVLSLIFFTGCSKSTPAETPSSAASGTAKSNDIVVWGEVKYNDEYQINIDFPSTVSDIFVKEGDTVKKGDTLVALSAQDYEKNLKKLQAQADSTKGAIDSVDQAALQAEIDTLKKQISTKTSELNSGSKAELQLLQNSLTRASKEVKDAQDNVNKYQKLFKDGVISQAELDTYTDLLNQKQKAKNDALDNIAKTKRTLQEELDGLNTNLKYKEVQLNQQKNAATAAQIDLDIMTGKGQKPYLSGNNIVSNLDNAVVKEISVVKGSALGTQYAAQKVISLIDCGSLYVSAEVPEEFISQISVGSKVEIIPTANKDLKIPGQILRISNQAVEKDGDRIVKVQVKPDDKDNFLKPGYTADVRFAR
jgi:multidrug efflux pump subunit AcrA (membrane-fusion protein)